jgi:hypothetical protein
MLDLAELIPSGESILKLIEIAGNNNIVILAGLLKKTKTTIYSKLTFA